MRGQCVIGEVIMLLNLGQEWVLHETHLVRKEVELQGWMLSEI